VVDCLHDKQQVIPFGSTVVECLHVK